MRRIDCPTIDSTFHRKWRKTMHMSMQRRLQIPAAIVLVAVVVLSARRAATGAPEDRKLDYANDIRPIFQANCAKCHLNGIRKGGMDLGSRDNLLKGGESEEPAVVPHDSGNSRMIMLLTSDDPEMRMPQKAPPLPAEKIATIRAWIDRGAPWGEIGRASCRERV